MFSKRPRLLPALALLLLCAGGCALDTGDGSRFAPEKNPSLSQFYAGRFSLGAAVEPAQLETAEGKLLGWHFNSLVAENAMKPLELQPAEGRFDFSGADRIVAFAQRHGMKVRGHTLLWHERTPEWFWQGADGRPASRRLLLERLRAHIHATVGRYRGRVYAWDVVNEVIDPAQKNCLRDDNWFQRVGPDYIDWAFRFAHDADPSARLFVNDFETTNLDKRECLLWVVKGLRERGVPVHGVGHQMHISIDSPGAREIDETLGKFAALGVENQITELDISFYRSPGQRLPGSESELLARQGARYEELFRVFLAHADVTAVTFWGISDANTWLVRGRFAGRGDKPLPFDADQQPKPAYWGVLRALSISGVAMSKPAQK